MCGFDLRSKLQVDVCLADSRTAREKVMVEALASLYAKAVSEAGAASAA